MVLRCSKSRFLTLLTYVIFPFLRCPDILLAVALAALGACGPLAEVSKTEPKLGAQYGTIAELRPAEQAIADAQKLKRTDPNRAVGFYLCGLEEAAKELRKNPRDRLAMRDYDFALSRVFSIIRDAHLDPWTHPLQVPAPGGGEYVLTSVQLRTGSGNHRNST